MLLIYLDLDILFILSSTIINPYQILQSDVYIFAVNKLCRQNLIFAYIYILKYIKFHSITSSP